MQGLKKVLLGIAIIFIAGAFMISEDSSMGGIGELLVLIVGLFVCIDGVRTKD